jgi:hypothetical protein
VNKDHINHLESIALAMEQLQIGISTLKAKNRCRDTVIRFVENWIKTTNLSLKEDF